MNFDMNFDWIKKLYPVPEVEEWIKECKEKFCYDWKEKN